MDKVGTAPSTPTVTAPKAATISETQSTITVSWNASTSYNNTGTYWVEVSVNNGAWVHVGGDIPWNTRTYTYTITNHDLGTTYKFRVCAGNDVGWSGYSESEVVAINTMSPPTIGTINTFNPFVSSTLTVPLSGGAQSDGSSFKRMANVYVDNELRYTGTVPSSYNNTSVSVSMSSTNVVGDLGNTSYSSSTRFKVVAWIQNSAGTKSNTVSKTFTVNINSDGGATPTLAAPTISGGSFSLPSSCFIAGISTLSVKSGTGSVRRGGSVGVTLSYKIACTGYADKSGSSASYSGLTAGVKTITITCTDSRGLSSTQTKQIRVQSYSAPTIKNLTGARSSSPTTNAVLTYTLSYSPIYQYSSGVNTPGTQLNGINTQQISKDGSSWSSYTSGSSITGLSTENVYTIQLRVSDKLRTTTYTTDSVIIPSADVGLALRKKRVGINCVPQSSYALEVKGNTYLNGTVTVASTLTANALIKANKDIQIPNSVSSVDGSAPFAGSYTETAITNLKNHKSMLGSISISNVWYDIISSRHRNGQGDGTSYGMYLRSTLTSSGNLTWGKQTGSSTWQAERTILDSGNYKTFLLNVFPVGAIYITTTNTNPGTFLGGTWEPFAEGRVLIGVGTGNDGSTSMSFTAESTGGEYRHKLVNRELPRQEGNVQWHGAEQGTCMWNSSGVFSGSSNIGNRYQAAKAASTGANSKMSLYFNNGGQDSSHNNIQPYIATYIWRRVS